MAALRRGKLADLLVSIVSYVGVSLPEFVTATLIVLVLADWLKLLPATGFVPLTENFWDGLARYPRAKLVTFNGRGFDLPLLELAAFRYRCAAREYFRTSRKRFDGWHLDLMDWLCNFGGYRMVGGLNLLSKLLGKPGKMEVQGDMVYQMHLAGKDQEINYYCLFDTLDTYFVFLRTRILTGEITLEQEHIAVLKAKEWIQKKIVEMPALQHYLDNWGDWVPWP